MLTAEERRQRERRRARARRALLNPTRVTNPNAMRDALADALGDRPTIGALRGVQPGATRPSPNPWPEVRAKADTELAQQVAETLNPRPPPHRPRAPRSRPAGGNRNRYGHTALKDECARVASAEIGNRNNTTASASFKIGQLVCGGLLNAGEAMRELLEAAATAGLGEREARTTIRSGLRAGCNQPRGTR